VLAPSEADVDADRVTSVGQLTWVWEEVHYRFETRQVDEVLILRADQRSASSVDAPRQAELLQIDRGGRLRYARAPLAG
jgi:hypothetical protein